MASSFLLLLVKNFASFQEIRRLVYHGMDIPFHRLSAKDNQIFL